MSESAEGVSVSSTRQNAGRSAIGFGASAPGVAGGVKRPPLTTRAEVTLALVSFNEAARRSHAAASVDGFCAEAIEGNRTAHVTRARIRIAFSSPRTGRVRLRRVRF